MIIRMSQPWQHPKTGVWYYRARIPTDVCSLVAGQIISVEVAGHLTSIRLVATLKVSLRTKEETVARSRHSSVSNQIEKRWALARQTAPQELNQREIIGLAGLCYREMLADHEEDPGDLEGWEVYREPIIEALSHLEEHEDGVQPRSPYDPRLGIRQLEKLFNVDDFLGRQNLSVDPISRKKLLLEIAHAMLEAAATLQRRCLGDYSRDKIVSRFPDPKPPSVPTPTNNVTLDDLFNGWVKECHPSQSTIDQWRESIVHRQRFFNLDATRLIEEIFEGIHLQIDQDKNSVVYQLQPEHQFSSIYRARIASDRNEAELFRASPVEQLGPPPKRLRRPGRMNAAGVACFYGAFELSTCLAELRPVVGSLVVGARFELIRPIYVLDTTRFQKPMKQMSWFVKDQIRRAEQWEFMQSFMHEMSKPISPADEYIDYVPTQAVAEYFAHRHEFKRSGEALKIEAIIYKSAQDPNGRNIVLLADAAHVFAKEVTTPIKKRSPILTEFLPNSMASFLSDHKELKPSLRLDNSSLQTLVVHGAHYDASEYEDWIEAQ